MEWIDNVDSYICPVCGFETNNPNRFNKICPSCGFVAERDKPEARFAGLIKADKEGRVVVLPCKVGDTVYWVHNKTITRCRVYRIQKNHKGIFICLRGNGKSYGAFQADLTIGKTVFLTREEAEEALRRAENG